MVPGLNDINDIYFALVMIVKSNQHPYCIYSKLGNDKNIISKVESDVLMAYFRPHWSHLACIILISHTGRQRWYLNQGTLNTEPKPLPHIQPKQVLKLMK